MGGRMSNETCDVKENRLTSLGLPGKAAYKVFNNRIVEAIIVAAIAVCFLATSVIDGIFGTRTERRFVDSLRSISRDKLNALRKAQIRYVFRRHFGLRKIKIRLAGGSYWLSIPCIVEGRKKGRDVKYMAKIVNGMSATKHRYMTMLRNLGVIAGAGELRFDEYADARDMACFERHCLTRLKEQSVNAPAVIGMYRLNEDDYMLVMEFIEGQLLSDVTVTDDQIDEIFQDIRVMHDHGFVHGDIKLDNFLVSRGKIFIVDCLKMGERTLQPAKSFDLICALCAICQKVPVARVTEHARKYFSGDELNRAGELLDVAVSKADIELPDNKVRELKRALSNNM
jgi:hypothetical protein